MSFESGVAIIGILDSVLDTIKTISMEETERVSIRCKLDAYKAALNAQKEVVCAALDDISQRHHDAIEAIQKSIIKALECNNTEAVIELSAHMAKITSETQLNIRNTAVELSNNNIKCLQY